ncbi:hypothetical protein C2E20_6343 [Micractinium conductrix]|uniref:Uncharacterized protein n=1 Tax=Micractinium conductrix TaxID=554055 RepID=A0A2P6V864_9CHLO|nr:hypothetical protein C2E20_6343 [Micractinium conductrix]|eukprot:PSC70276.1 hypothetical protein C2E20_6343 [Micractinium conductrix]
MQAQAKIAGFTGAMRGTALQAPRAAGRAAAPQRLAVQAATITTRTLKPGVKAPKPAPPPPRSAATGTRKVTAGTGTKSVAGTKSVGGTRKISAIEVFSKERTFRKKQDTARPAPKILARIEQLRLLSKLEQSGLLSAAERSGLTLSKLESSGLLTTAENLGVLPLLGDRNVPGTLYTLAAALLAAGPAAVYFLPDDSTGLVALQAVVALACVLGGSAAWGGASLLSTLQKS